MAMLVIVCYDVATETKAGRCRLRRVAKACESVGQRVQKSVFECRLDDAQLEGLQRRLLEIIDADSDCLRMYRLTEPTSLYVNEFGAFRALDFDGPLVV